VRLDRAGFPFISGTVALATAAALTVGYAGAVPLIALTAFFTYFFRDPERVSPASSERVALSPADGRVLVAGPADPSAAPPGDWKQISIFLSPIDVHVNRSPVSGRVTRVTMPARLRHTVSAPLRGRAPRDPPVPEVWHA